VNNPSSTNSFFAPFGKDVEVNLDPLSHELLRNPMPGTILLHPSDDTSFAQLKPESLTIRLATPDDDLDIANLRLSVFSDFTIDIRKNFVSRSGQVLASRRLQGATCLVCSIPTCTNKNVKAKRPDVVLGSVECSVHEFEGTRLGRLRPECSVLYVTEVAVSPSARRCGVGTKLMQVSRFETEVGKSFDL
jgi:ribosomal protein S18 acetylase RimI-like enzyme